MFEELEGKKICVVFREGAEIRTAIGIAEKTTAQNFLRILSDYGQEYMIHSESIVKLKTKSAGGESE